MKKNLVLLLITFLITYWGSAQSLSPSVLAVDGAISKTQNLSLEWTLGELASSTQYLSENIITEGFHQPTLEVTRIETLTTDIELATSNNYNVVVSPNPVASLLSINLNTDKTTDLHVNLMDAQGKTLYVPVTDLNSRTFEMSVRDLPNGFYFLHLYDQNGYKEVFKISKVR